MQKHLLACGSVALAALLSQSTALPSAGSRASARVPAGHARPYAQVLAQPAPAVAAAAADATPAVVAAAVSEEEAMALEAARLDAEARRRLLRRQHARGALSDRDFQAQDTRFGAAIDAYATLARPASDAAAAAERDALRASVSDLQARVGARTSPLATAALRRGAQGQLLVESRSLEASVTQRVAELRATIPEGDDAQPAREYVAMLERDAIAGIRAQSAASDALPFQEATVIVQPVQQAQLAMMKSQDWLLRMRLRSQPAGAVVVFLTRGGWRGDFKTDTTRDIMRGKFYYGVAKPGYKTVSGQENLVDLVRGDFACELVPLDDPTPPSICRAE